MAVFEGLIAGTPPSLRIGIEIALAPELNAPMYAIAAVSPRSAAQAAASGVGDGSRRWPAVPMTHTAGGSSSSSSVVV
jgi:hypothetical protein